MSWRFAGASAVTKKAASASPQDISRCFCRLVAISPPTLDDDVIRSPLASSLPVGKGQLTRVGGLVMRTAVSTAAPPRHLRWQAAFTTKAYQTLSPIVWHHAFVSDTHMTNWRGGSDLFLTWVSDGSPEGKTRRLTSRVSPLVSSTNLNVEGVGLKDSALVTSNGGGYAFSKEAHPSH